MVALPDALRRGIEREVQGVSRDGLRAATERLMATYQRERPASSPIVRGELDALAYVAYRMPATFAAARHVLGQVADVVTARSVVDLGGGSGAAAWAAATVMTDVERITVVDQATSALALGERLWAEDPSLPPATWRTDVLLPTSTMPERDPEEPDQHGRGRPHDLAVLCYVVGELTPSRRAAVVDGLVGAVDTVVVVEPGTPTGHERVLEVRGRLLEAGWHVAAPCPHEDACPWAVEGEWCHVAARVQRLPVQRQLKDGALGHEDEKLAYVVMTRDDVARPGGRVVRHPRTRKGMVSLTVCHEDGDVRDVTVTRKQGPTFKAARKTDWGEAWPPA